MEQKETKTNEVKQLLISFEGQHPPVSLDLSRALFEAWVARGSFLSPVLSDRKGKQPLLEVGKLVGIFDNLVEGEVYLISWRYTSHYF